MVSKELWGLLESLDLLSNKAVFFLDEKNGETYALPSETQKKIDIIQPDAFYIFNNQPYILFFDLKQNNETREQEIHKQVWSFDSSPIIFIIKSNEIQIFNAFSYEKKKDKLQQIRITDEERNKTFSFWNLQSGESWKWLQLNQYKTNVQKKRVNQRLFENIKEVREKLTDNNTENHLSDDDANILILRLIFIRYLIDRNVKIDEDYIKGNSIHERRKSFGDLIEQPEKLKTFFDFLNEKFNGVLFKNADIQLSDYQGMSLANIFNEKQEPNTLTLFYNTTFYFEVFDFSIIPVEVISGIYESLISPETRNEHSAIYTPSFLVEYMLTDTVDEFLEKNKTSECKIFDPACGSGIFLVQAYRRMVDKEKKIYGEKVNKIRLREIAQNNLFGIDLNEQAIKVTCFSIYIAILDYQDPKTILDKFKFPRLIDDNFFGDVDFFETDKTHPLNTILKSVKFDFILGNPPWKKDKSDKHLKWVNSSKTYSKKMDGELEIAQSFLMRSKEFMDSHTVAALIVTSTMFYNVSPTAKEFKKDFLTKFCLNKFFDLSPVRHLVFAEKDSPASIVYCRLSDGNNHLDNVVKHLSIKYNSFLKYFKTMVIEKYDQKEIQQKFFLENPWMFKVALYGNTLDFIFLKKLEKKQRRLLDLFDGVLLFKGAGIHKGTKEKFESFPSIIHKEIIENSEVEKYFSKSNTGHIVSEEDSYIKSGRQEGLFEGMQILIKEQAKNESEIVISLTDKTYVFRSGVFSLSSVHKKDDLKCLYAFLLSKLYEYYVFITSGSWGVSTRPQIRLDEEYLAFPYIEVSKEIRNKLIGLAEQFIEISTSTVLYDNLNRINEIVSSQYDVNLYEKDLIDYVLNVSRYQFQENKQHLVSEFTVLDEDHYRNKKLVLTQYADVFIKEFEKIYADEYLQVDVYTIHDFIAMNFSFLKNKTEGKPQVDLLSELSDVKELFKKISGLSISKIASSTNPELNLFIQKEIKGFEQNSFYIIKPNEYKCWHRAMAWYDVAEIKEAIEQAELTYLKEHSDGY